MSTEVQTGVCAIFFDAESGVWYAPMGQPQENGGKFETVSSQGVIYSGNPNQAELEFFGGGVEVGEDDPEAVLREIREELAELLLFIDTAEEFPFLSQAAVSRLAAVIEFTEEEIHISQTQYDQFRGEFFLKAYLFELSSQEVDHLVSLGVITKLSSNTSRSLFRPYQQAMLHLLDTGAA